MSRWPLIGSNGILKKISNFNSPYTVFWELNAHDERGQPTGSESNLTEEFFYDALNRFDHSTLNDFQNLDLALDAIGNITSKTSTTDPAENVGTYTYHGKRHPKAVWWPAV